MTVLYDQIGILGVALARWAERDDTRRAQPEVREAANATVDAMPTKPVSEESAFYPGRGGLVTGHDGEPRVRAERVGDQANDCQRPAGPVMAASRRGDLGRLVAAARSPEDAEILRLALPAFGALVAEPLFLLADSAIVGRLGTVPLGALGIASQALTTLVGISIFLAYGTTAAVARSFSAGYMPPRQVELVARPEKGE